MSNEDFPQEEYKYSWNPSSSMLLQDFLTKFKPSMVQNDGSKPWIWVRGSENPKSSQDYAEAYAEASELLKKVTEKVESIKNDESIPTRSNKKTGAKSKKEVREQVQAEATEQLKEIAIKHGYVCGKWLIFAAADKVDQIWSAIAKSLVSGPLHATPAYLAKVSTSPQHETPNAQHLICVYLPDVYDKASVTEVMKLLLRNHGVNLSGVKSDLYTHIGIDSKHPSGVPSTDLKNAFFAELNASKSLPKSEAAKATIVNASDCNDENTQSKDEVKPKPKPKPKLKRKMDDPFASEEEEDGTTKIVVGETKSKTKAKPKLKSKAAEDPFATDDEDNKIEQKIKRPAKLGTKRSQSPHGSDEGATNPKKKKVSKSD
ncbi:UPF0696 protein C11orf68-like protein [Psilocybe cubensis]|uniref:UPF0696 protein C11orf68-like protein n=1 Tax=Psilocybe cubensis TaxID=181762 RepID=A0ACB8HCH7_PSICU|nr:UPF0696 protein C11orf68-like protein [Psilocybe cubensis]KAH9485488.1 UPF0696 protein C11orf68-like protein [Psilocybe cubensis]